MINWLEKQRYIIDFTLSSLLRRKVKNFGLLMLYTLIVFILASVMLFTYSIKQEASFILQGSPEIIVQKLLAGRHDLFPVAQMEAIKKIRGVRAVSPRLWGYYYEAGLGSNYTLLVPPSSEKQSSENGELGRSLADEPANPLFQLNGVELTPGSVIIGPHVSCKIWELKRCQRSPTELVN